MSNSLDERESVLAAFARVAFFLVPFVSNAGNSLHVQIDDDDVTVLGLVGEANLQREVVRERETLNRRYETRRGVR